MAKKTELEKIRSEWARWLKGYGGEKFFDAFVEIAQNAESVCVYCRQSIFLDIIEGGGVPDWGSQFPGDFAGGLDYGCPDSPDSDEEGTGSHRPASRGQSLNLQVGPYQDPSRRRRR